MRLVSCCVSFDVMYDECTKCLTLRTFKNLPWKRWIRAFLHTLAPRFSTECGTSPMFRICRNNPWHRFFDRSIKIDANTVASFPRVFVGQCEHKRRCISNGWSSLSRMNTNATFRLTKVYHIDWHWKVCMVAGWIATKQFWYLCQKWFFL